MSEAEQGQGAAGRLDGTRREILVDESVTIGDLPVTKILGGRRIEMQSGDVLIVREPSRTDKVAVRRSRNGPAGMAASATIDLGDGVLEKHAEAPPESGRRSALSSSQALESIARQVQINVAQHAANMEKARRESSLFFKGMFVCIVLSVAIVMLALVLLLMNRIETGIVTAVVSAVTQLGAGLLFRKETELRRFIETYDGYIHESQKVLTMINLAETIDDVKMRDAMKEKIMLVVLKAKPGDRKSG